MWWQMHGRFETPPCDPPKIAEKRRALIALISKAEEIEGDDKFFWLILGACRDTVFFADCKSVDEVTERYLARQKETEVCTNSAPAVASVSDSAECR